MSYFKKDKLIWLILLLISFFVNETLSAQSIDSATYFYREGLKALDSQNKYDLALQLFNQSLQKTKKSDSINYRNTYRLKGICFEYLGEYGKALNSFQASLRYSKNANDTNYLVSIYNDFGSIYDYLNNFDSSLICYLKANQYAKLAKINKMIGVININISDIFYQQKEFQKALDFLHQSRRTVEGSFHKERVLYGIGNIHVNLLNWDSLEFYNELLGRSYSKSKNIITRAWLTLNKGILSRHNKKYEKAEKELNITLKISDSLQFVNVYPIAFNALFDLYTDTRSHLKKINLLNKSKLFYDKQQIQYPYQYNWYYAETYKSLGDFKKAYFHLEKFKEIQDSIDQLMFDQKVVDMEKKYELSLKTEKINELTLKEDLAQVALKYERSKKIFLYVTIILLIVITLFITITSVRKRKKLKNDLLAKSNELATYTLSVFQKNSWIKSIEEKFSDSLSDSEHDLKGKIKELLSEININQSLDKDWRAFEDNFTHIHPKFFKTLTNKYPKLTPQDQKICALLMLRYSNKELSFILNITLDGVKSAKKRLVKKLALNESKQLYLFLQNIA